MILDPIILLLLTGVVALGIPYVAGRWRWPLWRTRIVLSYSQAIIIFLLAPKPWGGLALFIALFNIPAAFLPQPLFSRSLWIILQLVGAGAWRTIVPPLGIIGYFVSLAGALLAFEGTLRAWPALLSPYLQSPNPSLAHRAGMRFYETFLVLSLCLAFVLLL